MESYLIQSFWVVGLALVIFTQLFVLTKTRTFRSDLILCAWLALLVLPLIQSALIHGQGVEVSTGYTPLVNFLWAKTGLSIRSLTLWLNPTVTLLHGPLMYLYVKALIADGEQDSNSRVWVHIIPFLLFYFMFLSLSHPEQMQPVPNHADRSVGPQSSAEYTSWIAELFRYFGALNVAIFIGYCGVTVQTLNKHQQKIASYFSHDEARVTLTWVYLIPAIFLSLVLVIVANEVFSLLANQNQWLVLHLLSFFIFIIVLCFFGIRQKPVFSLQHGRYETSERPAVSQHAPSNQQSVQLCSDKLTLDANQEALLANTDKLYKYMSDNKPYMDPDFNVYSLSKAMDLPRRQLSYVLNTGLNKNFYQFINEYRLQEVKVLLKDTSLSNRSILDLAFRCGFKSKSSFNSLFKQYNDMTPSQYRRQEMR